jgi:hypothetical protein
VVRYSDALKRNEEEQLDLLLHTRSRYLPRELRAAPLETNTSLEGDGFMMDIGAFCTTAHAHTAAPAPPHTHTRS